MGSSNEVILSFYPYKPSGTPKLTGQPRSGSADTGQTLGRCQGCSTAVKGKIRAGIKAKKANQALCPSWHFLQETMSKAAAPELKSTGLKLSTWRNHILQMHPEK